ncbi:hypothetical protein BDZ89DRAFT_1033353 [Hymenopellis radicata]|nr:hypothetical protein BDZ89DRAFT_1033353 [Hymenopellis radicata]
MRKTSYEITLVGVALVLLTGPQRGPATSSLSASRTSARWIIHCFAQPGQAGTLWSSESDLALSPLGAIFLRVDLGTSAHPGALALAGRVTRGSKPDTRTRLPPGCGTRAPIHECSAHSSVQTLVYGGGCTQVHPTSSTPSRE